MQLKELTVTYGGKLNLGDYNSAHVECSVTALVDEGETVNDVVGQLFQQVKTEVRAQVRELLKKPNSKVESVFAGLPVDVREGLE
jgi:hypothetical protein